MAWRYGAAVVPVILCEEVGLQPVSFAKPTPSVMRSQMMDGIAERSGFAPSIVSPQRRRLTFFPASRCSGFLAQVKKAGFPPSSASLRPKGAGRSPVVVRTVIETAIRRGSKENGNRHDNHRKLHLQE